MSLSSSYAIIDGNLVYIEDGSISYELDAFSTFSITVPAQSINARTIKGKSVRVFINGKLIISGFVNEKPSYKIDNFKNTLVEINCYDDMGELSCKRAKSNAHYQNELVTDIVDNLLLGVNWVADYSTFNTKLTEKITIDLRDKETLFAQIVESVKSVPRLHLRYGGKNSFNQNIIEIGEFNKIKEQAYQGTDLTELSLQASSTLIYKIVEAYGGYSATQRITLLNALSDPRTTSHPDFVNFPIVQDPVTSTYYVENLLIDEGCELVKNFELTKTENNEQPSAQEIYEAGYALWRKVVRFLQSTTDAEIYSCSLIRKNVPKVGDRIFVSASVFESAYDELGLNRQDVKVFEVQDSFKITKIETSLEKYQIPEEFSYEDFDNVLVFDLEITDGEDAQLYDSELELYDRLDKPAVVPNADVLKISPIITLTQQKTGGMPANCNFNGVSNTGIQFVFDLPTPPIWATKVFYAVTGQDPSNLRYELVQYNQNNPSQDIILCVAPSSGSWSSVTLGQVYTLQIIIYYT